MGLIARMVESIQWWLYCPKKFDDAVTDFHRWMASHRGGETLRRFPREDLRSDRFEAVDWRRMAGRRYYLTSQVTIESWAGWKMGLNTPLLAECGTDEPEEAAAQILEATWDRMAERSERKVIPG